MFDHSARTDVERVEHDRRELPPFDWPFESNTCSRTAQRGTSASSVLLRSDVHAPRPASRKRAHVDTLRTFCHAAPLNPPFIGSIDAVVRPNVADTLPLLLQELVVPSRLPAHLQGASHLLVTSVTRWSWRQEEELSGLGLARDELQCALPPQVLVGMQEHWNLRGRAEIGEEGPEDSRTLHGIAGILVTEGLEKRRTYLVMRSKRSRTTYHGVRVRRLAE